MTQVQFPLTIYFDGSCPLCTREILLLTQFDHAQQLRIVDCSPPGFAPVEGYSRDAMMALIHARDGAGRWLIGAPVFAAAYSATGFSAIARLWGNARLQPLWRIVYPWIARNRIWLSRLGAIDAMTWVLHQLHASAAKRALKTADGCKADQCNPTRKP
jgi:predicted DCC family thiol-disulfide oxidoreductase YuxK